MWWKKSRNSKDINSVSQQAIDSVWAEDNPTNTKPYEDPLIRLGIGYNSPIKSNQVNGALNTLYKNNQFEQRVGGFYIPTSRYYQGNVVRVFYKYTVAPLISGNIVEETFMRNNVDNNLTSTPIYDSGSTTTYANGIPIISGGKLNTQWWIRMEYLTPFDFIKTYKSFHDVQLDNETQLRQLGYIPLVDANYVYNKADWENRLVHANFYTNYSDSNTVKFNSAIDRYIRAASNTNENQGETLPNIKGDFGDLDGGILNNDSEIANGAFEESDWIYKGDAPSPSNLNARQILLKFNANKSNAIYQDGAKVRPLSITTIRCIYGGRRTYM